MTLITLILQVLPSRRQTDDNEFNNIHTEQEMRWYHGVDDYVITMPNTIMQKQERLYYQGAYR